MPGRSTGDGAQGPSTDPSARTSYRRRRVVRPCSKAVSPASCCLTDKNLTARSAVIYRTIPLVPTKDCLDSQIKSDEEGGGTSGQSGGARGPRVGGELARRLFAPARE